MGDRASLFSKIAAARGVEPEAPREIVRASEVPAHLAPRNVGRRGPKVKITPEIIDRVCEAIANGAFAWVAARAAGISTFAHGEWLRRGLDPDDDPIFAEYRERVETAKAIARQHVERRVSVEHPLQWLARGPGRDEGNPDEPGWLPEKSSVEVSGKNGKPIAVAHAHAHVHAHTIEGLDLSKLDDGDLDELQRIFAKALPPAPGSGSERDRFREGEAIGGEGEEEPS